VTVTTSGGTSNGYNFNVTFGYYGAKWGGSPVIVSYKINENTTNLTGEGAEIQAAASTWSKAGANYSFIYNGSTSVKTSTMDNINEILWGSTEGSLATTYFWIEDSVMSEADIVLDNSYKWSKDGSSYDVQTIVLHELGHWLRLTDLFGDNDIVKVMYGYGSSGKLKRSLTIDEINGIKWIYGLFIPSKPSVVTNSPTYVASTTAILNGTVNANNSSTTVTFEYGTTTSYGNTKIATQSPLTSSGNTAVNASLSGLIPNALYHFRVKAVNAGGTTYGSDMTFTTTTLAPFVAIYNATDITSTGAKLNGIVNASNSSTEIIFEFGLTKNYGNTIIALQSPVTGIANTSVNAKVSSLTPNTVYHYRIKASYASGYVCSLDTIFVTSPLKPSTIKITSGNNQIAQPNSTLGNALVVTVADPTGVPVPGVAVTFAISSYPNKAVGQSLSATNTVTNSSGQASTVFKSGSIIGTYNVAAKATGLSGSPVYFTIKVTKAGATVLSIISGNNQTGKINTKLTNPFVVEATDQNGNTVSGVLVNFSVSLFPAGATGHSLSAVSALTNSSGQVSSYLTLGNKTGMYLVTASVTESNGISVIFSSTVTTTGNIISNSGNDLDIQASKDLTNSFFANIVEEKENPVSGFLLNQNYPNPFNPSTRIDYTIPENNQVILKIYNTLGVEVETLINRYHSIGRYSIEWNPGNNPGGFYFYVLKSGKYQEVRKMLYLK
jgi:hypothetical protein